MSSTLASNPLSFGGLSGFYLRFIGENAALSKYLSFEIPYIPYVMVFCSYMHKSIMEYLRSCRKLPIVLTILLFLVGLMLGCWPDHDKQTYLTTTVAKHNIQQSVQATGVLQAYEEVDVGAQVSGQITRLLVTEGQRVKKGDLLAEIDPKLAQNKLSAAEADLIKAQATLQICEAKQRLSWLNLQRQQKMYASQAGSQTDLDDAIANEAVCRAEVSNARADITAAKINVETAKTELAYTRIRAPMDGTVLSLVAKQGQTLVSTQQVPTLLKLANLDIMTVKVQISEADVARIRAGMPASFTLLGDPDTRYRGVLRSIELAPININDEYMMVSSTASDAVYYYAQFEVPNPKHTLRVAMTAQVTIELGERKDVLTIPQSAIIGTMSGDKAEVYVLENGKKVARPITLGLRNDASVEVTSGLRAGDEVIIGSGLLTSNGMSSDEESDAAAID